MMLAKSFLFVLLLAAILAPIVEAQGPRFFRRVGTFFPCSQIEPKCNTNVTAVAEIVTASRDGNTLIYTDSEGKTVGFVNITDPSKPIAAGFLPVSGEPTSVTIVRDFAVAVIDTSPNKINTTGEMIVINIASKSVVATFQLGGQPDCINVSPDGNSLAIAIENERNETLGSGNPPQLPEGFLVLVDSSDANPAAWSLRKVTLTGLTGMTFPTDPEPEYVSINSNNVGVVSLQENNAFAIFDVNTSSILRSFTAGNVTLEKVDANENIRFVSQNQTITVTRQPDSVAWMGTRYFASADEGDLSGSGGRTFTVFDSTDGSVAYSPGNELEWWAVRTGHYSEDRSANGGNEPEGAAYAEFGTNKFLFILSERSGIVFVYDMSNVTKPVLHQVLATSSPRPEGIVTVPSRDLFAVANEVDLRSAKYRASISIYQLANSSNYPSLLSDARDNMTQGPFIPFSALSGLAASPGFGSPPTDSTVFYSVDDSFFRQNRIFTIQLVPGGPSRVTSEVRIRDSGNKLLQALAGFSSVTNTNVINVDGTVNIDPEGICLSSTPSTAWIASEGSGDGVITLPNLLLRVNLTSGEILSAVTLPAEVNSKQLRFGFEGVAEYGNWTVVTFQRAWTNETSPRIGLYNFVTAVWKFVFYPLDAVGSPNGGWVGLSDITSIGNGRFLILERDDQAGPDAVVKRLYEINLGANLTAVTPDSNVTKTLKLDLIPSLAQTWGLIPEKVEGVTIDAKGNVWVNNDNDGMGSGFVITSGEQQLNNVGQLYSPPATVPAPKAPPVTAPLATPVTAPVTPPVVPPRKKCGLFKLSVFCLNGCGVVGRLLKICKK